MSLDTLLEAAEFLEWKTLPTARANPDRGYDSYAKNSKRNDASDSCSSDPGDKSSGGLDDSNTDNKHDWKGVDKRRAGGRAHLKECFDVLKDQVPNMDVKKVSNLGVLRASLRYVQSLKKKDREYAREMQAVSQQNAANQERIASLLKELIQMNIPFDPEVWVGPSRDKDQIISNSTSTASEGSSPRDSEDEDVNVDENDDDDDRILLKPEDVPVLTVVASKPHLATSQPSSIKPLILRKPTPGSATSENGRSSETVQKPLKDMLTTSPVSALFSNKPKLVTTLSNPGFPPPASPPVTQLLQKTITQKMALAQKEALKREVEKQKYSDLLSQTVFEMSHVTASVDTKTTVMPTYLTTPFAKTEPEIKSSIDNTIESVIMATSTTSHLTNMTALSISAGTAASSMAASKPTLVNQLRQSMSLSGPLASQSDTNPAKTPVNTAIIKVSHSIPSALVAAGQGLTIPVLSTPVSSNSIVGTSNAAVQSSATRVIVKPANEGHTVTAVGHILQAVPASHVVSGSQLKAITQLMSRALPETSVSAVPAVPAVPIMSTVPYGGAMTHVLTPTRIVAHTGARIMTPARAQVMTRIINPIRPHVLASTNPNRASAATGSRVIPGPAKLVKTTPVTVPFNAVGTGVLTPGSPVIPVVPSGAVAPIPMTQIVNVTHAPIVMSGLAPVSATIPGTLHLTQSQIAGVFNQQLIKANQQIPAASMATLIQAPTAFLPHQLVGQPQLVKPLFMVSMPSMVTIATTTTPVTTVTGMVSIDRPTSSILVTTTRSINRVVPSTQANVQSNSTPAATPTTTVDHAEHQKRIG